MTPEQNRIRGMLAATSKHHPDDTERVDELKRELRASRLADHITRIVDAAPPLSDEQRTKLALLLRPAVREEVAA